MNNKEKEVLRLLSMFKYLTLKGKKNKISYSGMYFSQSSLTLEISENSLTEPDVDKIEISRLQINFNGQHNKIKRTITVDFGYGNSIEKEMKKSQGLTEYNANFYKYVFYSDEYRRLTVKKQMEFWSEFTKYNQEPTYARTSYLFKCVVIQIHVTKKTIFETFMNRPYGSPTTPDSWKYYFNQAVIKAKDGNFTHLDKYHHDIYKLEITAEDRVALLKKLVHQYWGLLDGDGLREPRIFANLVSTCPDNHKLQLYNAFFAESAKLYRETFNNWKINHNLYKTECSEVLFWLIETFYSTRTETQLNEIYNQMQNLPEKKIIPILEYFDLRDINKVYPIGPSFKIEYKEEGIYLKNYEKGYFMNGKGRYTEDFYLSDGSKLHGQTFGYSDIIAGLACASRPECGIMRGKVYPFPAFAVFELHDFLSPRKSITDLLNLVFSYASIFVPFFKLVQGIKVISNLLFLGMGYTDIILNDQLVKKVLKSNDHHAKMFLYSYKLITTFYNIKDALNIVSNFTKAHKTYKHIFIKDIEELITIWGVAQTYPFLKNLQNSGDEEYITLANDMILLTKNFNTIKKP